MEFADIRQNDIRSQSFKLRSVNKIYRPLRLCCIAENCNDIVSYKKSAQLGILLTEDNRVTPKKIVNTVRLLLYRS